VAVAVAMVAVVSADGGGVLQLAAVFL